MAEERIQRRLAAILSADVVGYSRLMGIDEAGTLARLKAMRRDIVDPLIAAHSGRTFKLMGDGALVEFERRRCRHLRNRGPEASPRTQYGQPRRQSDTVPDWH